MKALLFSTAFGRVAAVCGAALIAFWLLVRICAGATNPHDELSDHGLDK